MKSPSDQRQNNQADRPDNEQLHETIGGDFGEAGEAVNLALDEGDHEDDDDTENERRD